MALRRKYAAKAPAAMCLDFLVTFFDCYIDAL